MMLHSWIYNTSSVTGACYPGSGIQCNIVGSEHFFLTGREFHSEITALNSLGKVQNFLRSFLASWISREAYILYQKA